MRALRHWPALANPLRLRLEFVQHFGEDSVKGNLDLGLNRTSIRVQLHCAKKVVNDTRSAPVADKTLGQKHLICAFCGNRSAA